MLSVGNPKSLCEFLNDVRDLGPFRHSTSALVSELAFVIMLAPHGTQDFKAGKEKALKVGARDSGSPFYKEAKALQFCF